MLTNVPVVIDNGSGLIKAGFAGDQTPKAHFPNFVGRTKYVRLMAGGLEGDIFMGPRAEEHRGLLSIRYPMEHGVVSCLRDRKSNAEINFDEHVLGPVKGRADNPHV